MANTVQIEISEKEIQEIVEKLKAMNARVRPALKKAINDATKKINKKLTPAISKRYAVQEEIENMLDVKTAVAASLSAEIKASAKKYGLSKFKVSSTTPNPSNPPPFISAKVFQKGSMKPLVQGEIKAFVTQFKSEHIAVAERVPGEMMDSNPKKQKIRQRFGPSPVSMARVAFEETNIDKDKILMDCIQKHMDTLFERKKKKG